MVLEIRVSEVEGVGRFLSKNCSVKVRENIIVLKVSSGSVCALLAVFLLIGL